MALYAVGKRNDITTWVPAGDWTDIGGGVHELAPGETGTLTIILNLTVTSGAGGFFAGQDGLYLDLDLTVPVTTEAQLPVGFQLLTIGTPNINSIGFAGADPSNVVTIFVDCPELALPSTDFGSGFPFVYVLPPNNAALFQPFTLTFTVTNDAGSAFNYQYTESAPSSTVANWLGDYDLLGPIPGDVVGGFYESLAPGIRAGEEATPRLVNPGPARGMIVSPPFTETNPLWGFPGTAVAHDNKLIYAVGGYTVGTDLPSIRVWDGSTDSELCKIPLSLFGEVPRAITFLLKYFTTSGTGAATVFTFNILVGTWDGGTTSADLHGRVFKLDPNDGSLTTLGDALTAPALGHIPYAADFDGSHIWLGSHRGQLTASGGIFKAPSDNPSAWQLDRDLTGTGQAAVVSIGARGGYSSSEGSGDGVLMMFGAMGQAGNAGLVGDRDAFGVYTVADTGPQTSAGNGYYGMEVWSATTGDTDPYVYVSYWDPATQTTLIRRRQALTGTTFSTVFTGAGTTQDHILALVADQSTLYAVAGSRTAGVYSGFVLFTRDGTTWTDATADLPLNTGDLEANPLSDRAFTNAIASIAFTPPEE